MPPKKKRKPRPTQSQKQSQRVTVNIGSTKSAPRKKKSGGGSRQPSTYSHNLAPTFITAPPVDYTPLLAMIQHHARPIVEQQPIAQTQTPLSSVTQATAQQMAGVAAEERRAGPTAGSFQPPPSQAREQSEEVRPADVAFTETLVKTGRDVSPTIPRAQSHPARGRPRTNTQVAVPFSDPQQAGVFQSRNPLQSEALGAAEEEERPLKKESKKARKERELKESTKSIKSFFS